MVNVPYFLWTEGVYSSPFFLWSCNYINEYLIFHIFGVQELNAKLSNYCYGTDDPTSEMTSIPTRQIFVSPGYTPPEYISKGS